MAENNAEAELTATERLVYDAVDEIQSIKRDNGRSPDFAMLHEVYNFLRPEMGGGFEGEALGALRTLHRRGLIEYRVTVNKIPMFGIKTRET